jgi:hypothetical protein
MDEFGWAIVWALIFVFALFALAAFSPTGAEKKFNTCIAGKVDPAVCAVLLKPACGGAKP